MNNFAVCFLFDFYMFLLVKAFSAMQVMTILILNAMVVLMGALFSLEEKFALLVAQEVTASLHSSRYS